MIRTIFYVIILNAITLFSLQASSMREIQEVRLAKAELALIDGLPKKALRLILKNIESTELHVPSYLFLANWHFKRGNKAQGLKVYYHLIKKLHDHRVLKARLNNHFETYLKELKPANQPSQKLYFTIAHKYLEFADNPQLTSSQYFRYLHLAEKYLRICKFYQYKVQVTEYKLGQIALKKNEHQKALTYLRSSKQILEEGPDDSEKSKIINEIDLLIGEALLKDGHTDAGFIYLKHVSSSPNSSAGLQQYANSYLGALSSSYTSTSFSYGLKENSNIHSLTNDEKSDFTSYESSLFSKNALIHQKNLNIYFTQGLGQNWRFVWIGNLADDSTVKDELRFKDYRSYFSSFEFKYDNMAKKLTSLKYDVSVSQQREANDLVLTRTSTTHSIEGSLAFLFKNGTLTLFMPYEFIDNVGSANTKNYYLGLTYNPFVTSSSYSPSYTFRWGQEEEIASPSTKAIELSWTNQWAINDDFSLFGSLIYTQHINLEPELDYKDYLISLSSTYIIPFANWLSLNASSSYETKSISDGSKIETIISSLGLSASF